MNWRVFKIIIGILILAFFAGATVIFIKKLPPLMKIIGLAIDVGVYYLTINSLIINKKKNENGNKTEV